MIYYLQGLLMGFAYAAPIGTQNLFVINTALTQPRKKVFFTALAVIFFDISLAMACFFGIGAVMDRFSVLRGIVLLVGCVFVLVIGVRSVMWKGEVETSGKTGDSLAKAILFACVLTWLNPQAWIDGTMMLGAFRATLPEGMILQFITGVASASCIWFCTISAVIFSLKKVFTAKVVKIINLICGVILIFYGVKLAVNFVQILPCMNL